MEMELDLCAKVYVPDPSDANNPTSQRAVSLSLELKVLLDALGPPTVLTQPSPSCGFLNLLHETDVTCTYQLRAVALQLYPAGEVHNAYPLHPVPIRSSLLALRGRH